MGWLHVHVVVLYYGPSPQLPLGRWGRSRLVDAWEEAEGNTKRLLQELQAQTILINELAGIICPEKIPCQSGINEHDQQCIKSMIGELSSVVSPAERKTFSRTVAGKNICYCHKCQVTRLTARWTCAVPSYLRSPGVSANLNAALTTLPHRS